eukprot:gene14348-biopygen4028
MGWGAPRHAHQPAQQPAAREGDCRCTHGGGHNPGTFRRLVRQPVRRETVDKRGGQARQRTTRQKEGNGRIGTTKDKRKGKQKARAAARAGGPLWGCADGRRRLDGSGVPSGESVVRRRVPMGFDELDAQGHRACDVRGWGCVVDQ